MLNSLLVVWKYDETLSLVFDIFSTYSVKQQEHYKSRSPAYSDQLWRIASDHMKLSSSCLIATVRLLL